MTAVLDTNVLVAAAIGRSRDRWPRARWLIDVALIGQRRFEPVTSLELMAELVTVLERPGMVGERVALDLERELLAVSTVVPIHGIPMGCRDPDDDKVVETALAGRADAIVSDDRDLHDFALRAVPGVLGGVRPLTVLSLDTFVALLHEGPRFSPLVVPEVLLAPLAA
jgi:putative PIN family toxin of toxin-antitoxin system